MTLPQAGIQEGDQLDILPLKAAVADKVVTATESKTNQNVTKTSVARLVSPDLNCASASMLRRGAGEFSDQTR